MALKLSLNLSHTDLRLMLQKAVIWGAQGTALGKLSATRQRNKGAWLGTENCLEPSFVQLNLRLALHFIGHFFLRNV